MLAKQFRSANAADLAAILKLLLDSDLFIDDVANQLDQFVVLERDGRVIATGGVELHLPYGLLRSVAVAEQFRSQGIAGEMVEHLTKQARAQGVRELYLLTTTARSFFERLGFTVLERQYAPVAIQTTSQFSELCPGTASFMHKQL